MSPWVSLDIDLFYTAMKHDAKNIGQRKILVCYSMLNEN